MVFGRASKLAYYVWFSSHIRALYVFICPLDDSEVGCFFLYPFPTSFISNNYYQVYKFPFAHPQYDCHVRTFIFAFFASLFARKNRRLAITSTHLHHWHKRTLEILIFIIFCLFQCFWRAVFKRFSTSFSVLVSVALLLPLT